MEEDNDERYEFFGSDICKNTNKEFVYSTPVKKVKNKESKNIIF